MLFLSLPSEGLSEAISALEEIREYHAWTPDHAFPESAPIRVTGHGAAPVQSPVLVLDE